MTYVMQEPAAITGKYGSAWRLNLAPDFQMASIANWIVSAPWAHLAWQNYWITVVHLRNNPGLPDPTLYDPRATHEIMVLALDPKKPINQGEVPSFLTPANYMEQWAAESDAAASKYVEQVIQQICNGDLSPDTDFKELWLKLFPFQNPGRAKQRQSNLTPSTKIVSDGANRSSSIN